ncbi:MAG: translation factor (SUA5), partial [Lachnospiraceae bacterium]|nr:translation factor (SUA5) [Lachnospiraceae bacterium]
LSEYPNEYTDNVYTLTEFTGETEEIPDPYGQPLTAYGECYEKITLLIEKLAEILNSFTKGGQ